MMSKGLFLFASILCCNFILVSSIQFRRDTSSVEPPSIIDIPTTLPPTETSTATTAITLTPCDLKKIHDKEESAVKKLELEALILKPPLICNVNYIKSPLLEICVRNHESQCVYGKNDCGTELTFMSCVNSKCMCDEADIYNNITKKCDGKIAAKCSKNKNCILGAICVRQSMESDEGICRCNIGMIETKDETCIKGYGQPCNKSAECDELFLVCKEGVCRCSRHTQVYDHNKQSCVSLVGAKCSENDLCTEWAYCMKTNTKLHGKCICEVNAIEIEERICKPVSPYSGNAIEVFRKLVRPF